MCDPSRELLARRRTAGEAFAPVRLHILCRVASRGFAAAVASQIKNGSRKGEGRDDSPRLPYLPQGWCKAITSATVFRETLGHRNIYCVRYISML